jgi:hypothetical protein
MRGIGKETGEPNHRGEQGKESNPWSSTEPLKEDENSELAIPVTKRRDRSGNRAKTANAGVECDGERKMVAFLAPR